MGIVDSDFDAHVEGYSLEIDERVGATLVRARESNASRFFLYKWR
jgi:hypothetical protein